jgi:hypothetical protein
MASRKHLEVPTGFHSFTHIAGAPFPIIRIPCMRGVDTVNWGMNPLCSGGLPIGKNAT